MEFRLRTSVSSPSGFRHRLLTCQAQLSHMVLLPSDVQNDLQLVALQRCLATLPRALSSPQRQRFILQRHSILQSLPVNIIPLVKVLLNRRRRQILVRGEVYRVWIQFPGRAFQRRVVSAPHTHSQRPFSSVTTPAPRPRPPNHNPKVTRHYSQANIPPLHLPPHQPPPSLAALFNNRLRISPPLKPPPKSKTIRPPPIRQHIHPKPIRRGLQEPRQMPLHVLHVV